MPTQIITRFVNNRPMHYLMRDGKCIKKSEKLADLQAKKPAKKPIPQKIENRKLEIDPKISSFSKQKTQKKCVLWTTDYKTPESEYASRGKFDPNPPPKRAEITLFKPLPEKQPTIRNSKKIRVKKSFRQFPELPKNAPYGIWLVSKDTPQREQTNRFGIRPYHLCK